MNNEFIISSFKKWLEAVISSGKTLIEMRNKQQFDREIVSQHEHSFVIAVGKSLDWGEELKEVDPLKYDDFCTYKERLPEARLVRNMREHDVEYLKGKGRNQDKFVKELTINDGSTSVEVDGTSTLSIGNDYLINGRLNVQETIKYATEILNKI